MLEHDLTRLERVHDRSPGRPSTMAALVAAVVLAVSLAGCGEGEGDADPAATRTAANGAVFNDSDVEFATQMIQHHAQALEMVHLTVGRDLDPAVQELSEAVLAAQVPEVQQLSGWLGDWDEEVPATSLDHANAHADADDRHGMEGAEDLPGMMTADALDALQHAPDAEFQSTWLEMMVEHHRGAVEMARAEQAEGEFADAVALAESIETSQTAEIERMESLLAS